MTEKNGTTTPANQSPIPETPEDKIREYLELRRELADNFGLLEALRNLAEIANDFLHGKHADRINATLAWWTIYREANERGWLEDDSTDGDSAHE